MKVRLFALAALILGMFAFTPQGSTLANGSKIPGQYIVMLDPSVSDVHGRANALAKKYGGSVGHTYTSAIKGFSVKLPDAQVAKLSAEPGVISIQQDEVVMITAQPNPTGIDRVDGELSSTVTGDGTGSVNVDVAIIDTGIIKHTDLNVVGGYNCSKGSASNWTDGNGHGTHVAGTVAALDNNVGVVGVAPGARLWAVRVLGNSGSGTRADVICGIDWVTRNANTIEVANMSLGGSGSDDGRSCSTTTDSYKKAICNSVNAGVTYVVAAGNSATDAATAVPAAYDMVITVSALADFDGKSGGLGASTCRADQDDTFASFSNYGADVDIIAPGVCITSTWKDGGYNTISGTSMASPHVAGAAALYKANNPGATPSQVQSALQSAGTTDWDNRDDGDSIKEPLLNVGGF